MFTSPYNVCYNIRPKVVKNVFIILISLFVQQNIWFKFQAYETIVFQIIIRIYNNNNQFRQIFVFVQYLVFGLVIFLYAWENFWILESLSIYTPISINCITITPLFTIFQIEENELIYKMNTFITSFKIIQIENANDCIIFNIFLSK